MREDKVPGVINDSTGIQDGTVLGPYQYAGSLKVLGFKADSEILERFLRGYLQDQVDGSGFEFSLAYPDAPIVYMVISDAKMQGEEKKGVYRNRSCQFHIPVRCESKGEGQRAAEVGSLQVFSYGSSMQNALTSTEVRGPYMNHCRMRVLAEAEDLDACASPQTLLDISPQVINPDLNLLNACLMSLDKVSRPDSSAHSSPSSGSPVFDPQFVFSLKQFQHAKWRLGACYQALIQTRYALGDTWIAEVKKGQENSYVNANWHADNEKLAGLSLNVFRYEYHPIVSALGLLVEQSSVSQEEKGKVACDTLKPVSYLSLGSKVDEQRMPVTEELGKTLCFRWRIVEGDSRGWENVRKK